MSSWLHVKHQMQLAVASVGKWAPTGAVLAVAILPVLSGCGRQESTPPAEKPPTREQVLLKRLSEDPSDLEARLALAHLYFDTDRPHRAAPLYLEILERRRDDPDVRTDLGTCYKSVGRLDYARTQYESVLQTHPTHVQATYNLAVVSEMAGDKLRAAELWDRVALLAPESHVARAAREHAASARRDASRESDKTKPAPTAKAQP